MNGRKIKGILKGPYKNISGLAWLGLIWCCNMHCRELCASPVPAFNPPCPVLQLREKSPRDTTNGIIYHQLRRKVKVGATRVPISRCYPPLPPTAAARLREKSPRDTTNVIIYHQLRRKIKVGASCVPLLPATAPAASG